MPKINIESCIDCPFHEVVRDPDPYDSFNSDDMAVLCTKTPNTEHKKYYAPALGEFEYKPVTCSCRPYRLREETSCPDWCPFVAAEDKKFLGESI